MQCRPGGSGASRWWWALAALGMSQASVALAAPSAPPAPPPAPGPEAAPAAAPEAAPAPPEAAPLPPPDAAPPPPGVEGGTYPTPEAPPSGVELPPGYYGSYPAAPEAVEVEVAPRNEGHHEHEGLFLRVSLGVGAGIVGYEEAVDGVNRAAVTTRGLAGLFGVSVGGRVYGNLIVHGDLMASGFGDGHREVDGTTDASNQIDGQLGLLGAGVTYYFMPANAYVTGIVGAGSYSEERDSEESVRSGLGVALAALIGKEWWVGRRGEWALGGALRTSFYSAPVEIARVDSQIGAFDIGLVFTTTYN
jgi:hypothetical protein